MGDLEDKFFLEKLNPLLLQSLKELWKALQNFNHEEINKVEKIKLDLLRFAFRHLFHPLYLQSLPPVQGSLFLIGCIHPDGLGDYYALLKTAKTLKQNCPWLEIHVVYTHQIEVPKIDPQDYLLKSENIHAFRETADNPILEPILEGRSVLPFEERIAELHIEYTQLQKDLEFIYAKSGCRVKAIEEMLDDHQRLIHHLEEFKMEKQRGQNLYEQMKNSLALIHIALALNTFENPDLAPKSLYFAETGNFSNIANCLQFNWFSMGLGPFEEGIFLKQTYPVTISWKDSFMVELLDVDYLRTRCLYLGYLPKIPQQMLTFIYLVSLLQKKDIRHIDILVPKLNEEVFHLNKTWLEEQGISNVAVMNRHKEELVLFNNSEMPKKTLRLLNVLPLPTSDFEKILRLCGDVVGCTGDGSLSDCLIARKLPFYEMRKHKIETTDSFIKIAEFFGLKDLRDYFQEINQVLNIEPMIKAKNLYQILQMPQFKEQQSLLLEFIQKYQGFEEALLSEVKRHLRPSIKLKEEELVQEYYCSQMTASEVYMKFYGYLLTLRKQEDYSKKKVARPSRSGPD